MGKLDSTQWNSLENDLKNKTKLSNSATSAFKEIYNLIIKIVVEALKLYDKKRDSEES